MRKLSLNEKIAVGITSVIVLGVVLFVARKFIRKTSAPLINAITAPPGVQTGGILPSRKVQLIPLAGKVWADVDGVDYSGGTSKSDVVINDLYPLSNDELYYVATYFTSQYGEKMGEEINDDLWYYFYDSDEKKHNDVLNKLLAWNV